MFNYNELKQSPDGMPMWESFLPIVLSIVRNGEVWDSLDLKRASVDMIVGLPGYLKVDRKNVTDYLTTPENRAGWAISYLKNAGLLDHPERGKYVINEPGRKNYAQYGNDFNSKILFELPTYKEYVRKRDELKINSTKNSLEIINIDVSPEEQMTEIRKAINNEVATDLLERILGQDPSFFESLVLNLLIKMGYQGKNGNSIVTKRSGDGGIDGVINQDPLGTQTVYIQAKRYKDGNNISSPAIRDFIGSLALNNSTKGVFITTSNFTKDALDTAERGNIILIDGARLVQFMLQYKLGVRVKEIFELLAIDEDFFEL